MAYAHKVNRVTIFGTSFNGAEEWSTGFFCGAANADAIEPNADMATVVLNEWEPFFESTANTIGYLWKTEGVRIARLNTDGTTEVGTPVYGRYATPIQGNSGANGFPAQIAVVATLLAEGVSGLSRRGRMFIPGVSIGIQSDGHIGTGGPANIASSLATFFSNVNSSLDGPGLVVNASKGRQAPLIGPGVTSYVTAVQVGNVYDTQRRRRNQLAESYSSANIT